MLSTIFVAVSCFFATVFSVRKCDFCGVENPTKICGGCGCMAYCNKDCQRNHWKNGHKNECQPEKEVKSAFSQSDRVSTTSPAASTFSSSGSGFVNTQDSPDPLVCEIFKDMQLQIAEANQTCMQCGAEGETMRCNRCKIARYCSRACQKTHWKDHQIRCFPAEELQIYDTLKPFGREGRAGTANSQQAVKGGCALENMVKGMRRMGKSEAEIESVIETVDREARENLEKFNMTAEQKIDQLASMNRLKERLLRKPE